MGKASRRKRQRRDCQTDTDYLKKVRGLLRAWQAPPLTVAEDVADDPAEAFGQDFADSWKFRENRNALVLQDPRAAITLGLGLRGYLLEEALPLLASLVSDDHDGQPLVVDVGSGIGVIGIALNRLIGARALLLDPDSRAAEIAVDLASRVGATIETHEAGMRDLPQVLRGRTPDLIVEQGVMFYTAQKHHEHAPGISWLDRVDYRLENPEHLGADTLVFIEAARESTLVLLDFFCAELLASFTSHAARSGLQLDLERSALLAASGPHPQFCAVFRAVGQPQLPTAQGILDLRNPGATTGHDGALTDWPAERAAIADTRPVTRAWVQRSDDGHITSRAEIRGRDTRCSLYISHADGSRFFLESSGDTVYQDLEAEVEFMTNEMGGLWSPT